MEGTDFVLFFPPLFFLLFFFHVGGRGSFMNVSLFEIEYNLGLKKGKEEEK